MTKKRGIVVIATSVIFVIGVIIAILVAGCGKTADNKVSTADEVIATSVQTVTQVVTDSQGNTHIEEETMVVEVKQTKPSEQSEKATEANAQNIANSDSKQNNGSHNNNSNNSNHNNSTNSSGNTQSSKSNSSSGQTSKSSGGTSSSDSSSQGKPSSGSGSSSLSKPAPAPATQPATKDPHEGKTWHEAEYKTEKVWVVDEEGYTWQKPIYETHDRTICNTCGADITDCVGEHGYNHLINGEDASYRNETVDTLVGYETVEEPEKGHWESKTTLVRPEGWY